VVAFDHVFGVGWCGGGGSGGGGGGGAPDPAPSFCIVGTRGEDRPPDRVVAGEKRPGGCTRPPRAARPPFHHVRPKAIRGEGGARKDSMGCRAGWAHRGSNVPAARSQGATPLWCGRRGAERGCTTAAQAVRLLTLTAYSTHAKTRWDCNDVCFKSSKGISSQAYLRLSVSKRYPTF